MSKLKNKNPPKWPLEILRFFVKKEYLEEIEGDMLEVYQDDIEIHPIKKARRRYAWQVLKLLRPSLLKRLSGSQKLTQYGMVRHQIKIGWRNILHDRMNSFINISGLTIGLTASLVIFIFIRYESCFDTSKILSDRTYRVVQYNQFPEGDVFWNTTAYPLAAAIREDIHEAEMVTQVAGPFNRMFSVENDQGDVSLFEEDYVLFADPQYLKVFDIKWVSGNPETALQQLNSVVLSQSVASKFFNYEQVVLGKTIFLNGKDPLVVTGIVEDAVGNSNFRYGMFVPYEFFKFHNQYYANNWSGNYGGTTFIVLPEDITEESVESKLSTWKKKYLKPEDDERISYFLQPLKEIHTETLYGSAIGSYTMPDKVLTISFFIAIFILAIAVINFINLVTANSTARSKEVGIRKAIGASRASLVKQFMFEKIILVIIAIGLSLLLTYFLLDQLNYQLAIINLQLAMDWKDASMIILIGCGTIALATIYPAIVLSSFKIVKSLKNETNKFHGILLRKSLTVFQFTIVQFFVAAAIVIGIQLAFFNDQELGFSSEAVVITPVANFEKIDIFRNTLLQNKNIESVAFGSGPPMAIDGLQLGTTYRLPNQSETEGYQAEMKIGDLYYLDLYGLKLISGRNFSKNKQQFDEFIVNEKLLKTMNWTAEEAIGERLQINEGEAVIIGVVKDYHNNSLKDEITPTILLNWTYFQDKAFIKIRKGSTTVLSDIHEIWKAYFPKSVYNYRFLDDSIAKEYALEQLIFSGFTVFSILVVFVAGLGLFGLMSFITTQKTKEVGIRKVLGASITHVVLFFSKEFILIIFLSFLIATPVAYYLLDQWLVSFEYRIDLSLWMFIAGGIFTFFVASLTSFFQILKAARINPVETLKSE